LPFDAEEGIVSALHDALPVAPIVLPRDMPSDSPLGNACPAPRCTLARPSKDFFSRDAVKYQNPEQNNL
jgi:hypothetical protein